MSAVGWAHAVVASPTVTGVLVQAPAPAPGAPGDPAAGRGEEFGKTSPLALVVILLLALATILLIRSMNKRLRNVPASFDPPEPADGAAASDRSPAADTEPTTSTDAPSTGRAADSTPTGGRRADEPPAAGSP